jgi:hypothetical protein
MSDMLQQQSTIDLLQSDDKQQSRSGLSNALQCRLQSSNQTSCRTCVHIGILCSNSALDLDRLTLSDKCPSLKMRYKVAFMTM